MQIEDKCKRPEYSWYLPIQPRPKWHPLDAIRCWWQRLWHKDVYVWSPTGYNAPVYPTGWTGKRN